MTLTTVNNGYLFIPDPFHKGSKKKKKLSSPFAKGGQLLA